MTSTPLRSPETPPHKQGGWVGKKNNGTHVGLSAAVRPRSRLDVRVRVGVGDGAVTQVRSMPCSAVVGLQQAELRMTQPMASLLANQDGCFGYRNHPPQIRLSALSMPPASALRHHPRHHSAPPLPPPRGNVHWGQYSPASSLIAREARQLAAASDLITPLDRRCPRWRPTSWLVLSAVRARASFR